MALRTVTAAPAGASHYGLLRWLARHRVRILNVAGPRASDAPEIEAAASALLRHLLATARYPRRAG